MAGEIFVSPSILAADFASLKDDVQKVEGAADFLHLDVMDGHYVPNISFGIPVIESLRKKSTMLFDVHLMISNPEQYVEEFARVGSDYITFHIETTDKPKELIQKIRSLGKKPGASIHPDTPIEKIFPLLPLLDLALVMTVRPGFGGQSFMAEAPERIAAVREEMNRVGSTAYLSVDGGINEKTVLTAVTSGANLLVAGSYVFGAKDPKEAIASIKSCQQ